MTPEQMKARAAALRAEADEWEARYRDAAESPRAAIIRLLTEYMLYCDKQDAMIDKRPLRGPDILTELALKDCGWWVIRAELVRDALKPFDTREG